CAPVGFPGPPQRVVVHHFAGRFKMLAQSFRSVRLRKGALIALTLKPPLEAELTLLVEESEPPFDQQDHKAGRVERDPDHRKPLLRHDLSFSPFPAGLAQVTKIRLLSGKVAKTQPPRCRAW